MNTGSREKWDAHFFTASIFMETKDGLHGNGRRAAPFPAPWQIKSILVMDTKLPSMPKYAELMRVCRFHLFTKKDIILQKKA